MATTEELIKELESLNEQDPAKMSTDSLIAELGGGDAAPELTAPSFEEFVKTYKRPTAEQNIAEAKRLIRLEGVGTTEGGKPEYGFIQEPAFPGDVQRQRPAEPFEITNIKEMIEQHPEQFSAEERVRAQRLHNRQMGVGERLSYERDYLASRALNVFGLFDRAFPGFAQEMLTHEKAELAPGELTKVRGQLVNLASTWYALGQMFKGIEALSPIAKAALKRMPFLRKATKPVGAALQKITGFKALEKRAPAAANLVKAAMSQAAKGVPRAAAVTAAQSVGAELSSAEALKLFGKNVIWFSGIAAAFGAAAAIAYRGAPSAAARAAIAKDVRTAKAYKRKHGVFPEWAINKYVNTQARAAAPARPPTLTGPIQPIVRAPTAAAPPTAIAPPRPVQPPVAGAAPPPEAPGLPKTVPGKLDLAPITKAAVAIPKTIAKGVEPSKIVEIKHGKETYATVIRAIHKPEVAGLEFNQHRLETLDKSIAAAGEWFGQYPDDVLHDVMATRGHGLQGEARKIQVKAFATLPKELKDAKIRRAIDEIADFNYRLLQKVTGLDKGYLFEDIHKLDDYFYGIYKHPVKVGAFLDYWKTTDRFLKHKKLPTYADARAFGLELRNPNPVHNLRAEYVHIARLGAMEWLKSELMRTGEGKFIAKTENAPPEWEVIGERLRPEPTFSDVRVEPDLARLIKNLLATNKITQISALNALRQANNLVRTLKFIGSGFHLLSVAKQSFADTGYFGFFKVWKPETWRGITAGFRKNDPTFETPEYKNYIAHGGGHRYSIESEARRAFSQTLNKLTRNSRLVVRGASTPLRLPVAFVNWMFKAYIPKVKYAKYLDRVTELQRKLGRPLTGAEKTDIIKEQQNFYGMMNERLFGRSGTVTTALRFWFISPGYAEGNFRTIVKAATQWGARETYRAGRSRSNILNSLIITTMLATVGTLIMTGKWPKPVEDVEDLRDLLKIDTGKVDEDGKRIMIDLATYDKDYWNIAFNVLRGRPDIAIDESIKRIGGMKAPSAELLLDLATIAQGKAIWDWKENRVYEITDPFLQKIMKTTVHEIRRTVPISASVLQQSLNRDIDTVTAVVGALLGLRPARTEKDKREFKIIRTLWSLRDQRQKLSFRLAQYDDPFEAVDIYNRQIQKIIDSEFVKRRAPHLVAKAKRLLIDPAKVITWKRFPPEKMTVAQLKKAIRAHTYIKDQKENPLAQGQWRAHKGYERTVGAYRAELLKRQGGQ